jgi:UDP-N-acetylglucosamine diphosphorylase/glucosamine-1-phosphate N-acetyltransferase
MLSYPLQLARDIGSERIIIVVGHQAERIRRAVDDGTVVFVHQQQQLGTGHAIRQTKDSLADFLGNILILCGDVPLLLPSTIRSMMDHHTTQRASVTLLTALPDNPSGYGRIVKDGCHNVIKIVEERDATDDEKTIREINTGIYCVQSPFLFEAVELLGNENAQGEYYLTDIVAIARKAQKRVIALPVIDPQEAMGINTREDLAEAHTILREREACMRTS